VNRLVCLVLLAAAGCSRTLYTTTAAQSTAAPDVALTCVQEKLKELGYDRVRYDAETRWVQYRRYDYSVKISSGTFRRAIDLLDIRVNPEATGNTALQIEAHSYHQYELQRGQTDEERPASNKVKADVATLAQACGQP
jgi:hypothetical protein